MFGPSSLSSANIPTHSAVLTIERRVSRGIPSPDVADAFALTFAYPARRLQETEEQHQPDLGRSLVTGY